MCACNFLSRTSSDMNRKENFDAPSPVSSWTVMFSKKLYRLLPAGSQCIISLFNGSCPQEKALPGELGAAEQSCLPAWGRGGLAQHPLLQDTTGRGASRDSPAGLNRGPTLCCPVPCLPLPAGPGVPSLALGCALSSLWYLHLLVSSACPCSHRCVGTSSIGLSKSEFLGSPLPGTPAKPSPAQPPASRTQTQGPASSQTYGEEERQSNRFSY